MLRVGVCLTLVSLCLVAAASHQVYRNTLNTKAQRHLHNLKNLSIIGGNATSIEKHPYQASILLYGYFRCAAAIVSRKYVLTLADCVSKGELIDFQVRVGSNATETGGTLYDVKSIIINPGYNRSTISYDLGLIKLRKSIKFSQTVKKVSLSTKDLSEGKKVVLSGWGTTINGNNFNEVTLAGFDRKSCDNIYKPYGYRVDESMICAWATSVGPCQDDFGDPIVAKNKLYGLFAWSGNCADDDFPGVYSSVSASVSWIKETMKT